MSSLIFVETFVLRDGCTVTTSFTKCSGEKGTVTHTLYTTSVCHLLSDLPTELRMYYHARDSLYTDWMVALVIAKGYVPPGDVIIPLCSCSHSCSHLCYLASPLFTPWVSMWLHNRLLVVVGQMCHLGACAWGYRVAVFILRVKKCYCTLLLSVEFKKKFPISYKYEPVQYNKVYTIVIHIASTCTWDPKLEAQKPEAVDNVICIHTRQCYYFILSVSSLMICDGLEFLNLCRTTCMSTYGLPFILLCPWSCQTLLQGAVAVCFPHSHIQSWL